MCGIICMMLFAICAFDCVGIWKGWDMESGMGIAAMDHAG